MYYISSIGQAEGGDFHSSGRWFQGMQDLCKKYGMNVSKQYMIFSSLFNFHFLNIPLLPFRSQLIIDEVQTGGGATGRLREASQIVQNNPQFVKFYFSTQERCGCTNTSIFAMGLMLLPLARKCFLEGSTIRYILGLLSILSGYLCNRYSREIIKFFFYQI